MTHDDLAYYERRKTEERARAEAATCAQAAVAHRILAEEYCALLASAGRVGDPIGEYGRSGMAT